jgi:hypothetical protein
MEHAKNESNGEPGTQYMYWNDYYKNQKEDASWLLK